MPKFGDQSPVRSQTLVEYCEYKECKLKYTCGYNIIVDDENKIDFKSLPYYIREWKQRCSIKEYAIRVINCGDKDVISGIGKDYKDWTTYLNPIFISAQTGSGKSHFIENELLSYLGGRNDDQSTNNRMLILTNRVALWNQTMEHLKHKSYRKYVEVKSYQSLRGKIDKLRNKQKDEDKKFQYIVCDECHFFTSDAMFNPETDLILSDIVDTFQNAVRIYMTATPDECFRYIYDKENLKSRKAEDMAYTRAVVRARIRSQDFRYPDIEYLHMNYYHFNRNYDYIDVKYFTDYDDLKMIISEKANENKEQWLVFIDNTTACDNLKAELTDKDNKYGFKKEDILVINAKSKGEENYEKMIAAEEFTQKVLISTSVIDNGINLKCNGRLKNIVISEINITKFLQMLGRIRVGKDKNGNKERITLYLKKFTDDDIKKQIEYLENQRKAYYSYYMAYPKDSLTFIGNRERIGYRRDFLRTYYNSRTEDFEKATDWFYRDSENPEKLEPNEIAVSLAYNINDPREENQPSILKQRYQSILDEMKETGDGQRYLEYQLWRIGKTYDEENDITFQGITKAQAEFDKYIEELAVRVVPKDAQDDFGKEFFNKYVAAYGLRRKKDGFKGDDNKTRTDSYGMDTIKDVFQVRKIPLRMYTDSNDNGAWVFEKIPCDTELK